MLDVSCEMAQCELGCMERCSLFELLEGGGSMVSSRAIWYRLVLHLVQSDTLMQAG